METYGVTTNPIFMPGNVEPRYSEFLALHRHLGRPRHRRELLPGRHRRLPAGLPERHRLPEEVRLLGRAGVPDPRHRADRGPGQRRGRHPERLLLALPADRDLRLRHPAERARSEEARDRRQGSRARELNHVTKQGVGSCPIYDYLCQACGPFEERRPMSESKPRRFVPLPRAGAAHARRAAAQPHVKQQPHRRNAQREECARARRSAPVEAQRRALARSGGKAPAPVAQAHASSARFPAPVDAGPLARGCSRPIWRREACSPRPSELGACCSSRGRPAAIEFGLAIGLRGVGAGVGVLDAERLAGLLWLVNLGCIDLNPWYARYDDVDRPDYLRFDLDPVPEAAYAAVVETAQLVRTALRGSAWRRSSRRRARAACTSTWRSFAGRRRRRSGRRRPRRGRAAHPAGRAASRTRPA